MTRFRKPLIIIMKNQFDALDIPAVHRMNMFTEIPSVLSGGLSLFYLNPASCTVRAQSRCDFLCALSTKEALVDDLRVVSKYRSVLLARIVQLFHSSHVTRMRCARVIPMLSDVAWYLHMKRRSHKKNTGAFEWD